MDSFHVGFDCGVFMNHILLAKFTVELVDNFTNFSKFCPIVFDKKSMLVPDVVLVNCKRRKRLTAKHAEIFATLGPSLELGMFEPTVSSRPVIGQLLPIQRADWLNHKPENPYLGNRLLN